MAEQWLPQVDARKHDTTGRPPIEMWEEERAHLVALPTHAYDTAEVLYRTVGPEWHIPYKQHFYSVPWSRIGQSLPVRVTETELIVYSPEVREIARHDLVPPDTGGRSTKPEHLPERDEKKRHEQLAHRFDRPQYEQLATGDFIRRRSNVLLVGQSGVGKSHLMQAIGLSACALGYRVLYTTSAEMILKLTAALADKSLRETLKRYASWDVLVVDEFGFERDECPQAAHLLYKVITGRHLKRSTILITNIDFDAWGQYLDDAPLAMAMLDRLVENAVVIKIKGPSYRARRPTADSQ